MRGIEVRGLKPFRDFRGEFVQLYGGRPDRFLEDDISVSKKGVLRGIHGDGKTAKLMTCISGKVFLAVVDPDTKGFMTAILDDRQRLQIFIPKDYGVGYQALTDPTIVHYNQTEKYAGGQFTMPWDGLGIDWPIKRPILSERDGNAD